MEAFKTVIWIINIFSSLAVITLVLMQHGKGADAGANFGGSGSAQGVFGSGGNANFLTRMTGLAALVFFATCLALGYINTNSKKAGELDFSNIQQTTQQTPNTANAVAVAPQTAQMQDTIQASAPAVSESSNSAVATATAVAAAATAKAITNNKTNGAQTVENKNTDKNSKKAMKSTDKTEKSDKKANNKTTTKTDKNTTAKKADSKK